MVIDSLDIAVQNGIVLGCGMSAHYTNADTHNKQHAPYFLLGGESSFFNGSQYVTFNGARILINGFDNALHHTNLKLKNEIDSQVATMPTETFNPTGGKKIVVVDTSWSGNYYHFMVDLMGKVGVLSKFIDPKECVFLFNTWQKFHREAFSFLGLETHWIAYDKIYQGDFIYPSLAGASGAIPRDSILFLRSMLLPKVTGNGVGDYVYLSRGGAKRKILNESAVISELQKVAPFVFINAEDYSFADQISIFKSAKIVVGSHGAGLVNSLFMQEGTAIVELLGPNYQAPMFRNLAYQANLIYKSIGYNSDLMSLGQSGHSWDSDYEFNIEPLFQSLYEVFQNLKGF